MPVSKSDAPQDFAFLTKVVDLTVSEDIWGLFDPGASLSRDPATFILDTKGSGFWNQDIMEPGVDIDTIEAPGELHGLRPHPGPGESRRGRGFGIGRTDVRQRRP